MIEMMPALPWPEWIVTGVIGKGSFATVYRAVENVPSGGNPRECAVKIISFEPDEHELRAMCRSLGSMEAVAEHYNRLLEDCKKEISVMKSLERCANIVPVSDFEFRKLHHPFRCYVYIRMPLLCPLKDYMAAIPLDERAVLLLGIDLCRALDFCHFGGVFHRDIKPDNIFVSADGVFMLGDFGIASFVDDIRKNSERSGTPLYMPPEIFRHKPFTGQSDIYSLGLVMYVLLNRNCLPFAGRNPSPSRKKAIRAMKRRARGRRLPFPRDAGWEAGRAVRKACSPNPLKRYPDAGCFRRELERVLKTVYPPPPTRKYY